SPASRSVWTTCCRLRNWSRSLKFSTMSKRRWTRSGPWLPKIVPGLVRGLDSFMIPKVLFLLALGFAASRWASPPLALTVGLAFGLMFKNPFAAQAAKYSRVLLQASVVGLGFGMNLHDVVRAGRRGFVYTLLGIAFAMIAGLLLGATLKVRRKSAFLISTGTAICGGSAIAAVGPVAGASDEEMAVSLATIFVLNSVA